MALTGWRLRAGLALLVALLAHACIGLAWMLYALVAPVHEEQLPEGPGQGLDIGLADSAVAPEAPVFAALDTTAAAQAAAPAPKPMKVSTGGGGGGRSDSYFTRVRRHLHRFRSPEAVTGTGTAELEFEVEADGSVGSLQLHRSAGDARLDQLALDLVRRAAPLPRPPEAMRLVVPVEFQHDRS